jgi:hypothetical protein
MEHPVTYVKYINAAAGTVMLYLQHDFCNINYTWYIASGSADLPPPPPPPQGKILGARLVFNAQNLTGEEYFYKKLGKK